MTDRAGTTRAGPRNLFPVSHSVVSPSSVLADTADAYGISPTDCSLVRPGLNDTYLLRTRGDRFIVRLYGAGHRSVDEIHYELTLLLHLAGKGVAVSTPLATADGMLTHGVQAPEGSRNLALFRYAEGEPVSWADAAHCRLAGRLAADIHAGADDFEMRYSRSSLDVERLIEAPLQAILPLLANREDDQVYLKRFAASLQTALETITNELDWGPCHGDFKAKNIHLAEIATAIDFDLCGQGWRSYDLTPAYRATYLAGDLVAWQAFIDGYRERRELGRSDLAAVPLIRVARHLAMLGSFAANANCWGAVDDATLDRWLTFFRRWDSQPRAAPVRCRSIWLPGRAVRAVPSRPCPDPTVEVSASLLEPRALAAEIAVRYPLAGSVTCRLLHRGLNETYLAVCEGDRYVARVYRHGGRSIDDVAYELQLLAHLAATGLDVPNALPPLGGEDVVTVEAPEGTRYLVLFPYVPGPPASWESTDHAALLGRSLAALHASTDNFESRRPAPSADVGALIDKPLAALRPFLAHRRSIWRDLHRSAEAFRTQLQKRAEQLDWGPCHGDFRAERVLLAQDRIPTVVGFDQCALGWRAWDLSIIAWSAFNRVDRRYWEAFIDGYTGVRPLGRADLDLAYTFINLRALWSLGARAKNAGIWGTRQVSDDVIDQELAALPNMRSAADVR